MRKLDVIGLHFEFFKEFGFEFNSSHQVFVKTFPHGNQVVFVHFYEYPDVSYLEYKFGVRIDQVEDLIHQFLPALRDYAERSLTLYQTPNKIGKELPKRSPIENDWQLSKVMMTAENFFVKTGFHWLDEMIDPAFLENEFYNKNDNSFRTQNFVYNAFRATALSKLYNPDNYMGIRQSFLKQIEQREETPFTIAVYLQFLNYLDKKFIC